MQKGIFRLLMADRDSYIVHRWTVVSLVSLVLGMDMNSWATGLAQAPLFGFSPTKPIAAKYPDDFGIADDPDVIFADDFESWKNESEPPREEMEHPQK